MRIAFRLVRVGVVFARSQKGSRGHKVGGADVGRFLRVTIAG